MKMDKDHLRVRFRQRAHQADHGAEGRQAAQALLEWEIFQKAQTVACFVPLPWEIDTGPVNELVWAQGKRLALPRAIKGGNMVFHWVKKEDQLVQSPYGILEPRAQWPEALPHELGLILAPAEAVDAQGVRLGKGGGYYDRYLAGVSCPVCALILKCQLSASPLIRQKQDVPVGFYVSGGRVIKALP